MKIVYCKRYAALIMSCRICIFSSHSVDVLVVEALQHSGGRGRSVVVAVVTMVDYVKEVHLVT